MHQCMHLLSWSVNDLLTLPWQRIDDSAPIAVRMAAATARRSSKADTNPATS